MAGFPLVSWTGEGKQGSHMLPWQTSPASNPRVPRGNPLEVAKCPLEIWSWRTSNGPERLNKNWPDEEQSSINVALRKMQNLVDKPCSGGGGCVRVRRDEERDLHTDLQLPSL